MCAMHELVESVRTVFCSGRTLPIEWRRQQLKRLLAMLDERKDEFVTALHQDLNKPECESVIMDIDFARNEAVYALNHLTEWVTPHKVNKDLIFMMDDAYIRYEPFGVALIIGPWNYPLQLTLTPLVGALAAGNCVVLKPSEVSEHTAALLGKLCPIYLDKEAIRVVNGGVPETTELLKEKFDYIFYTGNNQVGKIIAEAAAKHLTPVTLELGGKSPVFVDNTSDIDIVARRLMWGKFINSGQTCVAPDYVLCGPEVQGPLIEACKRTLRLFYGEDPKSSDSYGRVVNKRHFDRIKGMLDASFGRVAVGGDLDAETNYISPTLLVDVTPTDAVMKEEIFGPLLPFLQVKDADEAISVINSRDRPLALYLFSNNNRTIERFLSRTSSGGVTVNDTIMHITVPSLPFGGIGSSGVGCYHGKCSFETFSHKRSCFIRAQKRENFNDVRYPPYTQKKLAWHTWLTKKSPKSDKIFGIIPKSMS